VAEAAGASDNTPKAEDRHPTGRREVLMLCAWLEEALEQLDYGDEAGELQLWDAVMLELCRQVEVECSERGRLLVLARDHYTAAVKKLEEQVPHAIRL
jgi:hypothetical protein